MRFIFSLLLRVQRRPHQTRDGPAGHIITTFTYYYHYYYSPVIGYSFLPMRDV